MEFKLDLNKRLDLNLEETYVELCNIHNKCYLEEKKKAPLSILVILGFISIILGFFGKIIFFIPGAILILVSAIILARLDKPELRKEVENEYYTVIMNYITKKFNGINNRSAENMNKEISDIEDEDFEKLEEYYENKTELIKDIFGKVNRKFDKHIDIDFDIQYFVKGHKVNILRLSNYNMSKHGADRAYYVSFSGYIVSISNFTNENLINNISMKDCYYDKSNKILYLIISDINNKFVTDRPSNFFKPNLNKRFEEEKFLEKKFIFINELSDYINKLIDVQ